MAIKTRRMSDWLAQNGEAITAASKASMLKAVNDSDMDGSGEETKQFASVPRAEDSADESSDAVSMRFVRPSPAKVRGHKEEEL